MENQDAWCSSISTRRTSGSCSGIAAADGGTGCPIAAPVARQTFEWRARRGWVERMRRLQKIGDRIEHSARMHSRSTGCDVLDVLRPGDVHAEGDRRAQSASNGSSGLALGEEMIAKTVAVMRESNDPLRYLEVEKN